MTILYFRGIEKKRVTSRLFYLTVWSTAKNISQKTQLPAA